MKTSGVTVGKRNHLKYELVFLDWELCFKVSLWFYSLLDLKKKSRYCDHHAEVGILVYMKKINPAHIR